MGVPKARQHGCGDSHLFCAVSLFSGVAFSVLSSFPIILLRKNELVDLIAEMAMRWVGHFSAVTPSDNIYIFSQKGPPHNTPLSCCYHLSIIIAILN